MPPQLSNSYTASRQSMLHCMHPQPPATRNSPNTRTVRSVQPRRNGKCSGSGFASLYLFLLLLLLLSPPPSPLLPSILSFRVARSQRQAHPLKEDDRLEDTQAPANGFVLLASIGIKRKPPLGAAAVRFGDNDAAGGSCTGENKWTRLH